MITILCVLYNKKISQISSLENFLLIKRKFNCVDIIIYDNSNKDYQDLNQKEYTNIYNNRLKYINNNGNIGLSKVYNLAIEKLSNKDYIFVSDDDTYFSIDYLNNAISAVLINNELIVSGMVKCDKNVISPIKKLKIFNKSKNFIRNSGYYNNIYCINSGLLISVDILRKIGRYDEELFLDFVDNSLMEKLKNNRLNRILIVDGDILQNFSGFDLDQNRKKLMFRYGIFKKDFNTFCIKYNKGNIYKNLILIKRDCGLFVRLVIYYGKSLIKNLNAFLKK